MNENNKYFAISVLPDGKGGFTPCPELLTEVEACLYLRLDEDGSSDPKRTLKYYRDKGQLPNSNRRVSEVGSGDFKAN